VTFLKFLFLWVTLLRLRSIALLCKAYHAAQAVLFFSQKIQPVTGDSKQNYETRMETHGSAANLFMKL
jgi:hypothetical protein